MSFNSSGVYTVPTNTAWTAAEPLYSEDYNAFLADLKIALDLVVNRGVESQMLAALLMGGFKLTDLSATQSQYTALRYSSVFPTMSGNKVLANTVNTYASAATVIITSATSPFIQITGTTTIDTITAAAADDIGPYYLMARSVGLQFSHAGNIRCEQKGSAYTTRYADQMFLLARNHVSGNWNLSLLEKLDSIYWGQTVVTATGASSFVVPAGVYDISVCCISASTNTNQAVTELVVSGTTVCRARNGARIGSGGGDGGAGGVGGLPLWYNGGGGGGAGGYTGTGGAGGSNSASNPNPTAGAGGGGGGGGYGSGSSAAAAVGAGGGGTGLLGTGANGTPGVSGAPGDNPGTGGGGGSSGAAGNSNGNGGNYGGGYGANTGMGLNGAQGGALAWENNIAVTPGQTLTINNEASSFNSGVGSRGAVRIMYGGARSYPSNAADV